MIVPRREKGNGFQFDRVRCRKTGMGARPINSGAVDATARTLL
jgi:hypothetical protein